MDITMQFQAILFNLMVCIIAINGIRCCYQKCNELIDGKCSGDFNFDVKVMLNDGTTVEDLEEMIEKQFKQKNKINQFLSNNNRLGKRGKIPAYLPRFSFNGVEYFYSLGSLLQWNQAVDYCAVFGGRLVSSSLFNATFRDYIYDQLTSRKDLGQSKDYAIYWVGISYVHLDLKKGKVGFAFLDGFQNNQALDTSWMGRINDVDMLPYPGAHAFYRLLYYEGHLKRKLEMQADILVGGAICELIP